MNSRPGAWLLLLILCVPATAGAASHSWRFSEAFSNDDGTVQFVEMKECCGMVAEHELNAKWILAVDADRRLTFRKNLTGDTSNRHLLLATQGFADLPGVPTPDFIIPDGFLPVDGETLEYWMYPAATWTYASLPTDGRTSRLLDGSTAVNSPTNYAGESGSVDVGTPVLGATWGWIKRLFAD